MWSLIVKGGWVMWPILACGAVAVALFVERAFHLHRAQIKTEDFLSGIFTNATRGNLAEAVSICDQTPGPVACIVRDALLHADEPAELLEQALRKVGLGEIPRLEKNLGGLMTIAQIAPMLGLLGTVVGLIRVYAMMEGQAPLAEIGDLSGGIWQALITTAAGICVAVPAYAAHRFLLGRVDAITLDMEFAKEEIFHFLTYERGRNEAVDHDAE